MEKNYKSPQVEVIDLELENAILQASGEDMVPMNLNNPDDLAW